jgi:hypothetical protein
MYHLRLKIREALHNRPPGRPKGEQQIGFPPLGVLEGPGITFVPTRYRGYNGPAGCGRILRSGPLATVRV